MQGLDGSTNVFIKKGSLDNHMSQVTHESVIHVEDGDINLKLSHRLVTYLTLFSLTKLFCQVPLESVHHC